MSWNPTHTLLLLQCDGNALNIIVDEKHNEVKAFIDFGDVSHTNLVNELAILMAYAMIDKIRKNEAVTEVDKGVLEVGRCVVEGYSEVRPLSDTEMQLLPCLVKARLVTSVLFSAHTLLQRPQDKDYLTVRASPLLFPLAIR
jgi:Ser/Thr protein kinase RdoA (MazF antagonist)